jgi:(S)-2-hydroxyglutarate dehydrogenase
MRYDKIVVGGGLVGLATALALRDKNPLMRIAVLEKESEWVKHQSSRNSGVIHAGVYYKPGTKKALFALAGNTAMYEFCKKYDIPHNRCGKIIVATSVNQLEGLNILHERAINNGVEVNRLESTAAKEIEPHVNCLAALHIPSTGVVDFRDVARAYVNLLEKGGVDLFLNTEVKHLKEHEWGYSLITKSAEYESRFIISATGLFADRFATKANVNPEMKVVPFRGEYWELVPEKQNLVKSLIYPVPNPNFPFLGVHLTRLVDGTVHAGPNAVLALSREGYSWGAINGRDLMETLSFPGFWKLAGKYFSEGIAEMYRSFSKKAFLQSIQELMPEIQSDDLIRSKAGVRAQALRYSGDLIDDFYLIESKRAIFVLNAPSPAATASLEIGKYIAERA